MHQYPTGTVTFLFTDIEGSTKLAREHPEEWEAAQRQHHKILREAIESHGGFVFQIIGDAFCAAFHKAGDAVNAAHHAQMALRCLLALLLVMRHSKMLSQKVKGCHWMRLLT